MTGPVLVTGASGLIGGELVRVLERGPARLVTTARSGAARADHHCRDLAAPGQAAALLRDVRPETIVHLAGGTTGDRHELYRTNVLTTVRLLDAASALAPPPYCVVMGSAAEYGEGGPAPIAESAPLRPVSEYGRAKVAQTTLAQCMAAAAGLPLTVLRPFNVVSAALPATTALGHIRRQLLAGDGPRRVVECGRLDVVRDFVPLPAVAEAIRRLIRHPAPGEVLNVCTGVGMELGAVLRAVIARLGVDVQVVQRPDLLALPGAPRSVGDPSRLARVTGLRVSPTVQEIAALLLG